jgi:hypothetical protein
MYWRAWHALRHDRTYGAFGDEYPITFAAMDCWGRRYDVTGSAFEILIQLIAEMDAEYLEWFAEKARERQNKSNPDG